MGFEEVQKEAIRKLPMDRQWQMIQSNKNRSDEVETPEYFVTKIKSKQYNLKLFVSLKVQLKSQPIHWLSEFLKRDGLDLLIALIDDISKKPNPYFFFFFFFL